MKGIPNCNLLDVLKSSDPDLFHSLELTRIASHKIHNEPQHLHFSDHGVDHSDRIVQKIDSLAIMLKEPLNYKEVYILLAATFLHDIGMQSRKEKDLKIIREKHHLLSYDMIMGSILQPDIFYDLKIEKDYCRFIALVSKGHRQIDLNTRDYETIDLGFNHPIRMKLLAALLRFGDELDLEDTRIDFEKLKIYTDINAYSKLHWFKHKYVVGSSIIDHKLRLTYAIPPDYEKSEIFEKLRNMIENHINDEYELFKEQVFLPEGIFINIVKPSVFPNPSCPKIPEDSLQILLDRNYIPSSLYDWSNIVRICYEYTSKNIKERLNHIYKKDYFIERGVKPAFVRYLKDEKSTLFVITGQAGVGKTSVLCSLAERWSGSILYHSKDKLPSISELESMIRNCLKVDDNIDFNDIIKTINSSSKIASKHLLLFIDTDLYVEKFNEESSKINEFLEKYKNDRIKIVITLRDYLDPTPLNKEIQQYTYKNNFGLLINTGISEFLNNFQDDQLDEAVKLYSKYFDLKIVNGFSPTARERIKYPQLLRLFSEANSGKILQGPIQDIRYVELGAKYWNNVYEKSQSSIHNISYHEFESSFLEVMKEIRENGYSNIPINQLKEKLNESIVNKIIEEGVITRDYSEDDSCHVYKICFPEFQEYLMALQVIDEYRLLSIDDSEFQIIENLFYNLYSLLYDFSYGLIQFTLLLLEQKGTRSAFNKLLNSIYDSKDSTWHIIGCTVLSKCVNIDAEFINILNKFSKTSNTKVLIYFAETIGKLAKRIPDETATFIFRLLEINNERLRVELVRAFFRLDEAVLLNNINKIKKYLLNESKTTIKAEAASALVQVNPELLPHFYPLIDDLIASSSETILIELSKSLSIIGNKYPSESVEYLKTILSKLKGNNKEYPISAIAKLTTYGDKDIIQLFLRLANSRDDNQKVYVAKYVKFVDEDTSHKIWEELTTGSESMFVRMQVAEFIYEMKFIDNSERNAIINGNQQYRMNNYFEYVLKLDGKKQSFDFNRLWRSIYNAAKSIGGKDEDLAKKIAREIMKELQIKYPHRTHINISEINEVVTHYLRSNGYMRTLDAYLSYRKGKYKLNNIHGFIKVLKKNNEQQDFNLDLITQSIYEAARSLGGKNFTLAKKISADVIDDLSSRFEGRVIISTSDIRETVIKILIRNGHNSTSEAYDNF